MAFLIRHWKIVRRILIIALVITMVWGAVQGYLLHDEWVLPIVLFVFSAIAFSIFYLVAKTIPATSAMLKRTWLTRMSATFFPRMFFIYGLIALVTIVADHQALAELIGFPLAAVVGLLCSLRNFLHEEARKPPVIPDGPSPSATTTEHQ